VLAGMLSRHRQEVLISTNTLQCLKNCQKQFQSLEFCLANRCNGDPALLEVLAAAGACFDCASEAEIQAVVGSGVAPDRIIFANACKRPSDIRWTPLSCLPQISCSVLSISAEPPHAPVLGTAHSRASSTETASAGAAGCS